MNANEIKVGMRVECEGPHGWEDADRGVVLAAAQGRITGYWHAMVRWDDVRLGCRVVRVSGLRPESK